jgi:outer membrane protein assembly factor BamD
LKKLFMNELFTKMRYVPMAVLALLLAGSLCAGVSAQKKPKVTKVKPKAKTSQAAAGAPSAEPDKVLYDRALDDIRHRKFTEGRLSLQTLINTYPDSEYLAKAKLSMADSFYKEGGTSNLTQAIEEYKNFIVFFPFLDEAAFAQMQVGMAHYQMMEKSDRDTNQAQAAESELQTFLLKYPESPLTPQAEQRLRDVQEVLADGEFRIGRYYFVKQDYRASAARLMEVSERYPLYSESDDALAMLGDVYQRARQASKSEDDKNHWGGLAAQCYSRIVRDYPLSSRAAEAKTRLADMGLPVPPADPQAVARMQQQQLYEKHHHHLVFLRLPLGMIKSRPDVYVATRSGPPNLNPPDDSVSATEVLKPGAAGPSFNLSARRPAPADDAATDGDSTPVEILPSNPASGLPSTTAAAEIIEAPAEGSTANASSSSSVPAVATPPAGDLPAANAPAANAPADPGAASPTTPAATSATPANAPADASTTDSKTESTSKKKKGLKKLVPW